MSVIQFHHSFPFDPRYGYDLDRLLEVSAPEEPDDFVAFWRNLYATARQVDVQPALYEVDSRQDAWRLFDVEFFRWIGSGCAAGWCCPAMNPWSAGR